MTFDILLKSICDNLDDGLMLIDADEKLFFVNKSAKEMLKIPDEIYGGNWNDVLQLENLKPLLYLLGKEKKEISDELEIEENLVLHVKTKKIFFEGGRCWYLVYLKNITREKLSERMKNEFLIVASHQLRTPLTALSWVFEQISSDNASQLEGLIREGKEHLSRMHQIVNEILQISEIEGKEEFLRVRPCNFEDLIKNIVGRHKEFLERKKLRLELKFYLPRGASFKIDPQKVTIVIENLLNNAIFYTEEGGLISCEVKKDNSNLIFSITDTGIGISEGDKKLIFSKFFRSSRAMEMKTEGSGLGLYISKKIIEAHGGKMWFESEQGKGSTFYFSIPIK